MRKPKGYWEVYENNKNEALKYKTRKEFSEGCGSAYKVASKKGWLDTYTWFVDFQKPYTYEECYEIALTCKNRHEMENKNQSAYHRAKKMGWLKDYTWFTQKKPNGYYNNYDICHEEALKYNTIKEFEKGCPSGYNWAKKNGWLYEWFESQIKESGYWDIYENVYNEALKYKTLEEFSKNSPNACNHAYSHEWIYSFTWLERKQKPNGYWDIYENVYNEALKYKTVGEFQKYAAGAYDATFRHDGWIDTFTWFERAKNPFSNEMDSVYAYFFTELNAVYVGRTINTNNRNKEHHTRGTVFNFAKANNIDVPLMTILESNLSLDDGLIKEDFYVQKYRNEGWNVLNIAKTGKRSGSIGGIGHKWNKDEDIINEGKKYSSRWDFHEKNRYVYEKAKQRKLLDVIFPKAA